MEPWSVPRRIAFRFGVVFAAILILPFPLDLIPKTDWLVARYGELWEFGARRLGDLIGVAIPPTQPTGSGDTMLAYVMTLLAVIVAIVGAGIWSALDRKRTSYPRVAEVTRIGLRYWLGVAMLSYGFAKVFKSQFPYPFPDRLEEPLGQMSPMGVLWTFMGYSTAYNVFAGAMECLGGALLMWRRTTALGAAISMGVLANVVMLNFCYDVPVKLYSSELIVVAIVLVLPDASRLMRAFLGLATQAAPPTALPLSPRMRRAAAITKLLAACWITYKMIANTLAAPDTPQPPLGGRFDVVEFRVDGVIRPPLESDAERWRRFAVTPYSAAVWRMPSDEPTRYQITFGDHTLNLVSREGSETFTFVRAGDTVVLDGTWAKSQLHVVLHERPPTRLETRGFHWVAEFPYNR